MPKAVKEDGRKTEDGRKLPDDSVRMLIETHLWQLLVNNTIEKLNEEDRIKNDQFKNFKAFVVTYFLILYYHF